MKTRQELSEGEYKTGILLDDDRFLTRNEIDILLLDLAHLWRECTKDMALIKFGAFCARCSVEEMESRLFGAKLRKKNRGLRD